MANVPVVKRLFNSGEFSPKVYGRTDIDRYEGGSKTMLNMVPIPQGGVVRRPGTRYIATAAANHIRLVPFQFSTTQAYVLELSNGTARVFKDGGIVLSGSNAYTFNTPFTANDLGKLQWAQSFDKLYVTHQNYWPQEITRTAHNNWSCANYAFANNSMPTDWGGGNNNGAFYVVTPPRMVSFYQDRLVFGSSTNYPSRLWFSKTSAYNDFTTGTNDSDGFSINLLSGTADVLFWLTSHKALIAGGDSGVWSVSAANGSTAPISPTNRRAYKDSYFGSAEVIPAALGEHIIYPQYLAGKIRDLSYSYEKDGYGSSEASVLADHLIEGYSIKEISYQQSPFEIVWMRRSDGNMLALTYLAEHKVIGWSRHTMGNVLSLACIPGTLETELWIATQRTINNNTATYIERMEPFYFSNATNAFFVDCGLSGNLNNTTAVSNLGHLANMTVQYWTGTMTGNATVANNAITLAAAANSVVVGLGYNSEVETLPIEAELKSGPTMFATKRITGLSVRCRNTGGGSYGPDANNQTRLLPNNALFSGDVEGLSMRGTYNSHHTAMLRQTEPLPLAIDAIGLDVEVS